jgi:ABC-2 type transport system ATP-binding protein
MVEIKNLSFGYTKETLFSHLDLTLEPGNIFGLLGRNGAGKTTLLKLICGLRYPQEGDCRVLGFDPGTRPAGLLEDTYLIPEEFFVPPLTPRVYETLYSPFYPRFDSAAFQSYRKELEVPDDKKLSELSYGQKKKFLLAFGLATRCRLLLLDEPTNGLDIPSKSQFRKLLAQAGEKDQIILISTHQVRDMENLIDPVIILDEGRVIFQKSLFEITEKLSVHLEQDEPEPGSALYWDRVLGGYVVVRENTTREETKVDLEVLFNTVVGSRDKVDVLFQGGSK